MASWRELGGPALAIGRAAGEAVRSAQASDRPAFEAAAAELSGQPTEQTGLVLGAVLRVLLEEQHAGGLDGDDIREVLTHCYRNAIAWLPPSTVGVEPLVATLSSALGIHEAGVTYREVMGPTSRSDRAADEVWADPEAVSIGVDPTSSAPVAARPPTAAEYIWHSSLLIGDLLTASGRSIDRYLDRAFTDIARSEAMEMP